MTKFNLHSLTTKIRSKLIASYSPLLVVQNITEEQSISAQSKVTDSEIRAGMDFLRGILKRVTKGSQDNINSVGFKKNPFKGLEFVLFFFKTK